MKPIMPAIGLAFIIWLGTAFSLGSVIAYNSWSEPDGKGASYTLKEQCDFRAGPKGCSVFEVLGYASGRSLVAIFGLIIFPVAYFFTGHFRWDTIKYVFISPYFLVPIIAYFILWLEERGRREPSK